MRRQTHTPNGSARTPRGDDRPPVVTANTDRFRPAVPLDRLRGESFCPSAFDFICPPRSPPRWRTRPEASGLVTDHCRYCSSVPWVFVLPIAVSFFWRDDDGGGDFVVGVHVEEADALRGAAGGADGLGVDADDLPVLADDHQLRGVVDQLNGVDLADAVGDGHVLDAAAAARLQPVLFDIGALAKAVF